MKRIYTGIVLYGLMVILAVFWLVYPANVGVIVLEYHSISDRGGLYCLTPDVFEQQMRYLAENGYTAISLEQMAVGLNDYHILPDKPMLITFDDGYADNYNAALPILEKFGQHAAVFIITDKIGQPGYLTWDQIKAMEIRDIDIGSHTVSHRALNKLSANEQEQELKISKEILEQQLAKPVNFVAYPYGGFNAITVGILDGLGYKGAFSGISGINTPGTNPYMLKRIPMLNAKIGLWRFELYLWKLEMAAKVKEFRSNL
jgi:peptidoglycan/xylan/chitin deacetylase (PgdA/CDA1 family)